MYVLLPGRQPFVYYMCISTPKGFDFEKLPAKVNWQALVIQFVSIFLHVSIQVKIKLYKIKLKKSLPNIVGNMNPPEQAKAILKQNLWTFEFL